MNNVIVVENYDDSKRSRYIEFLTSVGSDIDFNADKWICDKRLRSPSEYTCKVTISFTQIPLEYKAMVKYFAIIRLINGKGLSAIKQNVIAMGLLFNFMKVYLPEYKIDCISSFYADYFKEYLDNKYDSEATKNSAWQNIHVFFRTMNGFEGKKFKDPFSKNPYKAYKRYDYKYIPENIIQQLDKACKDTSIELRFRCVYWILRLIPSRISEVLGMKMDCLKSFNGHYQLFIPTWKQNGGHKEPILRTIRLEYSGIAAYLIDLIKEQQQQAKQYQQLMSKELQGMLFTYQETITLEGIKYLKNNHLILKWVSVSIALRRICKDFSIKDDNGKVYNLTSHQFRHNGITDRLEAGFTMEQIAEMTGHHGNAMIFESYAHLDLKPQTIIKKQKYVLNESDDRNCILFGGRILHMEEHLEKRLLSNIRAHRVRGGICSDITGCKNDMFNCLECSSFVPEVEQMGYFKEQVEAWQKKVIQFKALPMISQNAIRNVELFQGIVNKLQESEADHHA